MNESSQELDETLNSSNNYDNYFTETSNGLDITANNIEANCITSKNEKFNLDSEGNLTINSLTISDANNNTLSFEAIFNRIYPVGSIYISTNDINPSTLFTGTWEKIENRFLLASGSSYQLGSTGGEATHKLTINELPSHTHNASAGQFISTSPNVTPGTVMSFDSGQYKRYSMNSTSSTGGSKDHNNMPPYLVVSIYKRIS
ncbi:MAG TPA: hypothetical protein IAC02_08255 [Candidatus Coprovivens excrementavium]|nr:hypothetical protein [Candidatus Coprovivens excrementavium]